MKKTLAFVISLLMLVSCMVLPVHAETVSEESTITQNSIAGKFIVTFAKNNSYLITWYYGSDENIYSELIIYKSKTEYSVGDVLTVSGSFSTFDTFPAQIKFENDAGFEKIGSCDEMNFTVAREMNDLGIIELQNNGIVYEYFGNGETFQMLGEEYANFSPEEDETVTFYTYEGTLILPKLNSTPVETILSTGDIDGNGKIDILDVITVNKAILGKEKLTDAQLKAIDFNGNGKPDASETLTIMKYIVGLVTSFTE